MATEKNIPQFSVFYFVHSMLRILLTACPGLGLCVISAQFTFKMCVAAKSAKKSQTLILRAKRCEIGPSCYCIGLLMK